MHWVTILLLAIGTSLYGQSDAPKFGEVTFEFVFSGGMVPLAGRLIIDSGNGRVYDEAVTAEARLRLPYGKYLILFQATGFTSPVSRSISIDQPEKIFVLSRALTHFEGIEGTGPSRSVTIRSRVQPATACGESKSLWAKLVGGYSDYSETKRIQADGTFAFDDIDDGIYVLLILDSNRLRASQTITAGSSVPAIIQLQSCGK